MAQQIVEKNQKPYDCPHADSEYVRIQAPMDADGKNEHMCGKCGARKWK